MQISRYRMCLTNMFNRSVQRATLSTLSAGIAPSTVNNLINRLFEKDIELKNVQSEKDKYLVNLSDVRVEVQRLSGLIKLANLAYLQASGRLSVRGGLEVARHMISAKYPDSHKVQREKYDDAILLTFVEEDKEFIAFLTAFLDKKSLKIEDVKKSFMLLWHKSSDRVHVS
jgi:arginine deiminase